jgi:hypothetical protein
MNPNVLYLHGPEIQLAGAPGVFVAAPGPAMVKGRHEQSVLAHVVDDRDGDARNEIERVIPARRLHLAIAPHHRIVTSSRVMSCDAHGVELEHGRLDAETIIWAAGVVASPAARWLDAEHDRTGRVKVGVDLSVPSHPDIFVLRDTRRR